MTKHTKIEFGFGLELSAAGLPIGAQATSFGISAIRTKAGELFGGCTLVSTVGTWISPSSGTRFDENACTLFVLVPGVPSGVLADRAGDINALVTLIKERLLQEAVYVTVSEVLCALK